MRFMSGFLTLMAALAVIVGGVALGAKNMFEAKGPLAEARDFTVPRGAGLAGIAEKLEKDGVISSALVFKAAAFTQGVQDRLKAGSYRFVAGEPMRNVLTKISLGDTSGYKVRIIEGRTVAQAIEIIKNAEFLTGEITRIPDEGMMAPNTYEFEVGTPRQRVVDFLESEQQRILSELWKNRADGLPFKSAEEALILASIVEKETAKASEYPVVASVFVNRLQAKPRWRLDADSTTIYGLVQSKAGFDGDLKTRDLKDKKNPWNTRANHGLPPTAITIPGRGALEGTLKPSKTDYMFFVADGTGGHAFAKTDREHQRNVRRWIKIEREKKKASQN